MPMHNPPHPGEFIREIYITPFDISARQVAESLGVSASTLNRLLNGGSNISPEMALRLSRALGRTPESWLAMQDQYDLWHARKHVDLKQVRKLELTAA
ncbi:MAG: HigA family addiction module antidote protein [Xanthomonadaceae bacterium]|nr:HigA family addiction module antidote protein [Xanthomonadaceae bacterium]